MHLSLDAAAKVDPQFVYTLPWGILVLWQTIKNIQRIIYNKYILYYLRRSSRSVFVFLLISNVSHFICYRVFILSHFLPLNFFLPDLSFCASSRCIFIITWLPAGLLSLSLLVNCWVWHLNLHHAHPCPHCRCPLNPQLTNDIFSHSIYNIFLCCNINKFYFYSINWLLCFCFCCCCCRQRA